MIRNYSFPKDKRSEIADWLNDNIGVMGTRWWFQDNAVVYENGPTQVASPMFRVWIDLTEEEEPWLTAFVLRYA